ncbi:hypothetical protein [Cytobacillus praedii]|uniref:hypothetical protein n=1 Tax=Cytobacillus praedii TaxID=1742358 RepID=UPI0013F409FE|nr:hypothetical protein [Cytobacillus praedii]
MNGVCEEELKLPETFTKERISFSIQQFIHYLLLTNKYKFVLVCTIEGGLSAGR